MKEHSPTWQYFDKLDENRLLAQCRICEKVRKYAISSLSNLKKHLRLYHKEEYNSLPSVRRHKKYLADIKSDEEEKDELWSYFERDGADKVRCVVCTERMPRSFAKIKFHMRVKHSKLYNMKTEDALSSNDDADEKMYTDLVYLEDDLDDSAKRHSPSVANDRAAKSHQTTSSKLKPIRRRSSSSEEIVHKRIKIEAPSRAAKANDEIEQFGKYITCLLKQVPSVVCTKLQMDIVVLIANAKLQAERKQIDGAHPLNKQSELTPSVAFIDVPIVGNGNSVVDSTGFISDSIKKS